VSISIWGQLEGRPPEKIDQASSESSAAYLLGEYRLAFGKQWTLWTGRKDQKPQGVEPCWKAGTR